jgi:hypothetical protein
MRFVVVIGVVAACSLDPVHDHAVADLGPEAPDVGRGPLHRPNQPCLVCHGGSGPAKSIFSAAGTVYQLPTDLTPLEGASVHLLDVLGRPYVATTNAAGNFYVEKGAWDPTYPIHVTVSMADVTTEMSTNIGQDGSCASCHVDPVTRISAGHVFLAPNASLIPTSVPTSDGGAP